MNLAGMQTQDWIGLARTTGGIAIAVLLGLAVLRLARKGTKALAQHQAISTSLANLANLVIRWIVWIVVLLVILTQLGVQIGSLWAILSAIAAMVAIGFVAVWSLLSNLSCTVLLLVFRPFRIGDEIEIIDVTGGEGLRGRVVNLNFMYTVIEETDKETGQAMITQVPNNTFFQKTIRRRPGHSTVNLDEHLLQKEKRREADEPSSARPE